MTYAEAAEARKTARGTQSPGVPNRSAGTPGDCVPLAVFLASAASAYVTGSYYPVDGGHLLLSSPY